MLDTAGYGPLTINKAISIVNDGSIASILVPSGGTGILISAGPTDAVSLRGLTIEGAGVGRDCIFHRPIPDHREMCRQQSHTARHLFAPKCYEQSRHIGHVCCSQRVSRKFSPADWLGHRDGHIQPRRGRRQRW